MADDKESDTPALAFAYSLYHKNLVTGITRERKPGVSLFGGSQLHNIPAKLSQLPQRVKMYEFSCIVR